MKYERIDTPDYIRDLVIYEINTRGFTSPDGPESGTFNSLREKIGYLQELGITGIWLTGHHLCDANHFYNIWTEYACIDPGKLDPVLGTEADFAAMIETAHQHDIKVFLDVITHGVMDYSPLVKEHPQWFRSGSWRMADFDWHGGHRDMEEWWIETWLRYVTEFGVDGFRLDVAHYRNDIWAEIRKRSRAAGREILVIAENGPAFPGVIDMLQHGVRFNDNVRVYPDSRMLWDGGGYFNDRRDPQMQPYQVEVHYQDGSIGSSFEVRGDQDGLKLDSLQCFPVGIRMDEVDCERAEVSYGEQFMVMRLENVRPDKVIEDIIVLDQDGHKWHSNLANTLDVDYYVKVEGQAPSLLIHFPLRQQAGTYMSNQLSCHDGGWDGFPLGENPYMAQGSRHIFGYGFVLTPAVPVFMAGEEFDADYVPLPQHSPRLFGGELNGQGRWLYGSWLQWDQLEQPEKQAMLADVKQLLTIRRQYQHLIHPFRMECEEAVRLRKIPYTTAAVVPVPYLYQGEKEALCVMANPNREEVTLRLRLAELLTSWEQVKVTVLFGESPAQQLFTAAVPLSELVSQEWQIAPDKQAGGGLTVLLLEREG